MTDHEFRLQFERCRAECLANLRDRGIDLDERERTLFLETDTSLWSQWAIQVDRLLRRAGPGGGPALTTREHAVLGGVFEGLSNKQIAVRDGVSESAVKAVIRQLFRKLLVRSRAQLVRIAIERSLRTERKNR